MRSLGRYVLNEEIGRGSMGTVFRAHDPLIERTVAVKTVNLSKLDDGALEPRLRFLREAKAAGRLSHPSIVTVHDVGEFEEVCFIVMEFVEGVSLNQLSDRSQPIPLATAAEITRQVADALAYAHKNGVVHRDVKPGNVMLTRSGGVKIADFGIARIDQGAKTRTGILVGSPRYMSPEQLSGQDIDGRSDVFSLGSLLYELVTGRGPFDAARPEDFLTLMQNVASKTPEAPSRINPLVPASLDAIVLRALAKGQVERYATADAMANDLRAAISRDLRLAPGEADIAMLASPRDVLLPEFDLFADAATQPLDPQPASAKARVAAPSAAPRAGQGLMTQLRAQAEAIERGEGADGAATLRMLQRFDVERRMRAAFTFYQELVRYVGIVRPEISQGYELAGVGEFVRPRVADAFVDSKLRREEGRPWLDAVVLTVVGFSPTELEVKRPAGEIQAMMDLLGAANLRYNSAEAPNEAGETTLTVAGEITIYVRVMADRERGRIAFLCRNVAQFGVSNFVVEAKDVDDTVFEEFAKYLLGQPSRFLELAGRS